MTISSFPPLSLDAWQPTRDTLNAYAKVLGKIRRALTPPQKHWWHVSLRPTATGLTTTPMWAGTQAVELLLGLADHRLHVHTSRGAHAAFPLHGQAPADFCRQLTAVFSALDIDVSFDPAPCDDARPGAYDATAVSHFWHALSQIDAIFKTFRHGFRGESSPVQLWPHHFDLALLWFSGRLVPGQDPTNEEYADEQMNFGFSTGDAGIPEPYFYATAYPTPAGWTAAPLPAGARWHASSFTGAVLPYRVLTETADPTQTLLAFLRTTHEAGKALMQ